MMILHSRSSILGSLLMALAIYLVPTHIRAQNHTISLDLETAGQWNANFRTLSPIGTGTAAQTTLSGNTFFRQDSTSGNTGAVYLYDQSPADSSNTTQSNFSKSGPITVSLGIRAVTSTSSFSVVFMDPSNTSNNITAIFNLRTGSDQIRFFRDGPMATNAGIGTQVGTESNPNTAAEPNASTFTPMSVTLSVSGTTPTLTLNVDGASPVSYTFAAGDYNWDRTVIALRLNDAGTGANTPMDIDNIVITSASAPDNNSSDPPEPNVAPTLPTQANRTVAALDTLVVTNTGSDTNTPAQTLTYQLTTAPSGASISPTGVITWTPTAGQVSASPYIFTTVVTDSGTPALTATNSFEVTVTAAPTFTYSQIYDFSNTGAFTSNFRILSNVGGGTFGPSGGNFVFDARSSGGSTSGILLYDTTPNNTGTATQTAFPTNQQVRVSFLARAQTSGSSFSVIFADPRDASNRISAQFVINTGDDVVRFHRDGSLTATTNSAGTQVGSDVTFDSGAEPAGGTLIPVMVILTSNGTTPTLTVTAGGGSPVTSTFAAGDLDWNPSLVLLRFGDPSTSVGPLEMNNLVIAGGTPVVPTGYTAIPLPGADGNLLTINPSFESGSLNNFSGSYSFTGWNGSNDLFSNHAITSGSVAAGTTTDGTKKLLQSWGGTLTTAATARPPAVPGTTYELKYDQRSLIRNFPNEKLGTQRFIEFFDASGVRLKQVWGTNNDYKVQYTNKDIWETFTLRAVAPPGTAYVGVRVEARSGRFVDNTNNFTQDRHVEFDNFRLKSIPETIDRLSYRRAPRLVEPGKNAVIRLNHAVPTGRILKATLRDATGASRASAQVAVAAGRFRNTALSVAMPSDLPNGTYSWRLQLLPIAGGAAVVTKDIPGVIVDQTVATSTAVNGTDFDADHPRIVFMGRIENTNTKQQWLHWFGSEVRVRFSGTSLALRGTVTDNGFGGAESTSVLVIVNEDFNNPLSVTLDSFNFVKTLVSGLADGVHTVRIFKRSETDISIRVDGFRVDANRGLLVPEPLSSRKIEFFGDSVTSGGTASPACNAYAPLLGRELDADVHIVSKGGTGVAASFSSQDILVNYYDNLSFPNVFNASSSNALTWDFNRWTADVVVCAIGHNDQFNNGLTTFNSRYAEFKGYIRAAYPNAQFITANTLISANLGQFQNAVDPLIAVDPKHTFAFQPNTWSDSATAHPPTDAHAAQIYGDERRYSLAEVVEERAGWGLDAPLTPYEQWVLTAFSPTEINSGLHGRDHDADGDGVANFEEFAFGSTPTSPASLRRLEFSLTTPGEVDLAFFRARTDLDYILEESTNLIEWTPLETNPGTPGGQVTLGDPVIPGGRRFYRLRIEEP